MLSGVKKLYFILFRPIGWVLWSYRERHKKPDGAETEGPVSIDHIYRSQEIVGRIATCKMSMSFSVNVVWSGKNLLGSFNVLPLCTVLKQPSQNLLTLDLAMSKWANWMVRYIEIGLWLSKLVIKWSWNLVISESYTVTSPLTDHPQ